jgi:hypothetical protein
MHMLTQSQPASQLGGRGEALRKFDDFASSVAELQLICARVLQTNQKLIALLTGRIQPLPSITTVALLTGRIQPLPSITTGPTTGPLAAQRQWMGEMNQSFNLQYLMLQENMQQEQRQFTLLTNILKTRHDGAKNVISNVR